ncbi:hypothetical protein Apa02nite_091870 [Actinoplanes palleronii]|uniref:Uncharacterized protein n=1 Tax=Actinoplanes palleronii TaxID=113570 RepID=A0ABQ4BQW2_9ACTN|nr:hypothetical protein Apa02nite_091870 [Actinoplanes palleronii]
MLGAPDRLICVVDTGPGPVPGQPTALDRYLAEALAARALHRIPPDPGNFSHNARAYQARPLPDAPSLHMSG